MSGSNMRGMGYLHRAPTLREKAVSAWSAVSVGYTFEPTIHPDFPDLFHRFGALNQSEFSACTGFGVTMAARLQGTHDGLTVPKLSPLLPYWSARCRAQGSDSVEDSGAYVDDVLWAFNRFCTCLDIDYPFESLPLSQRRGRINERPNSVLFRAALKQRSLLKLQMTRIVDGGQRLLQRAAYALNLGQVCMAAIPVGSQFMHGSSETMGPVGPGEELGRHFVCLLDWRWGDDGLEFLCGNSWGQSWGDNGTAWLSSDLVKQTLGVWFLEGVAR